MYDDVFNDPPPPAPRLAKLLVLLSILLNCGWALADATADIVAMHHDPQHPRLRPYYSGRFGAGPFIRPTRAGVTAWLVLSRGAVIALLVGWGYFVLRHDNALAAGLYGATMASLGVSLCVLHWSPPPRLKLLAPGGGWIVIRTVWMLSCAGVAWWYAWRARTPGYITSVYAEVTQEPATTAATFDEPRAPDESQAESRPPA